MHVYNYRIAGKFHWVLFSLRRVEKRIINHSLSPLVVSMLRSLSHRKLREKGRQEFTLLFTPGALTWGVKLLLRSGKVSAYILRASAYND